MEDLSLRQVVDLVVVQDKATQQVVQEIHHLHHHPKVMLALLV
jgi:ribosomal protein S17